MPTLRGGIDLGGTKIQAIGADEPQEILGEASHPTPATEGAKAVDDTLAAAMKEAAANAGVGTKELAGVGLGSPGDVDDAQGTIANAGNLAGFDQPVPVAAQLLRKLSVAEVRLGNDVSVALNAATPTEEQLSFDDF